MIRPYDNIPVVSWMLLRGRCRDCNARISPRYPLVELANGLAFGALAAWLVDLWVLPAHLYLAAITVALGIIDLEHRRLPDRIVLPALPIAALLLALAALVGDSDTVGATILRSAAGAGILFAVYFVILFAYPRGMGFGDVKLAAVLGLYLGWWGWGSLVVGFFAAFVLGGAFSLVLVALGRAGRKSKVPFGPWMLLGAWVGIVAGEDVWRGYLSLVGL